MKKLTLCLLAGFAAVSAAAAEHEIKMLNLGDEGAMVFEPSVLKAAVGDTVVFVPAQAGHYVQSKIVPDGAAGFQSEMDKPFRVTLEKEGVYLYVCPPHQMMNMVGVIQAGEAVNLDAVKAQLPKLARRAMQNKGRLEKYVESLEAPSADHAETQRGGETAAPQPSAAQ